jgi:hypothetical protein
MTTATDMNLPVAWGDRQLVAVKDAVDGKLIVTDTEVRMSEATWHKMCELDVIAANRRRCVAIGIYEMVTKDNMPSNVVGHMLKDALDIKPDTPQAEVDALYQKVMDYQDLLQEARDSIEFYYQTQGVEADLGRP